MSRLTVTILEECGQRITPLRTRELSLRGKGLRQLEEEPLTLLHDKIDAIDMSHNVLVRLDGLPRMERLTQIIAHNNHICRISKLAARNLPNLESFVAHDNDFSTLAQLEGFAEFRNLQRISLVGSPVASVKGYRLFLVSRCPTLKLVDFQKVSDAERAEAVVAFPAPEASSAMGIKRSREEDHVGSTRAGSTATTAAPATAAMLTEEEYEQQKDALEQRLDEAETMEDIAAIEEAIEELERKRPRK